MFQIFIPDKAWNISLGCNGCNLYICGNNRCLTSCSNECKRQPWQISCVEPVWILCRYEVSAGESLEVLWKFQQRPHYSSRNEWLQICKFNCTIPKYESHVNRESRTRLAVFTLETRMRYRNKQPVGTWDLQFIYIISLCSVIQTAWQATKRPKLQQCPVSKNGWPLSNWAMYMYNLFFTEYLTSPSTVILLFIISVN